MAQNSKTRYWSKDQYDPLFFSREATHLRHIRFWLNHRKSAVVVHAAPARVTPTETPEAIHRAAA
jgi:hypothetical protein